MFYKRNPLQYFGLRKGRSSKIVNIIQICMEQLYELLIGRAQKYGQSKVPYIFHT